jgi:hypothetical protein
MRKPVFRTDDEWRTIVIMHLIHLRTSIFELGLLMGLIAVRISAARWWDGAPIMGAVIALIGAIYFYNHSENEWVRLQRQHFEADAD